MNNNNKNFGSNDIKNKINGNDRDTDILVDNYLSENKNKNNNQNSNIHKVFRVNNNIINNTNGNGDKTDVLIDHYLNEKENLNLNNKIFLILIIILMKVAV